MRASFLPFAVPDLGQAEQDQVREVLESGWITTGPKARQFERDFAARIGAANAVAVNSCTAAMHLALDAIGLQRGDLVITTPYTFAATAEVIRYFDAVPIFVDVDPETLNLDVGQLADALESLHRRPGAAMKWLPPTVAAASGKPVYGKVKAIMPVHMAGYPCDLDAIYELAGHYRVAVIEDAAHAFGTTYKGLPVGSCRHPGVPSAVCFSFYATKTLTTGEGGMICTFDSELAERCRIMALHGISKDAWNRYAANGNWYYEVMAPGYKYNMPDLAAALGLAQLGKGEQMCRRRAEIARAYTQAFREMPEVQVPAEPATDDHSWHLYMLRLHLGRLTIGRAEFITELKARNIGASVHFIPLHVHPYYRAKYNYDADDFPGAHEEYLREVSLPIYSKMTHEDVQSVIEGVRDIVGQHRRRGVDRGRREKGSRVEREECTVVPDEAVHAEGAGR